MKLVDSCGWLEYLADTINADNYAKIIEDVENLIVPTICITEVFKKVLKEKDENSAIIVVAMMKQGNIIELDEQIALNAAKYGLKYKLPLADSIIYATGKKFSAEIYTQDSDLKGIKGVKYFQKK
ncbi:MAG: type II toxin-antitoxin system VapC family toxin [Candidatus Marinimicrobia bacterium]|nr:type II toxin-antitoxin system VapC family toxin [Candidatus Neomarinimicrobiota bacterium]